MPYTNMPEELWGKMDDCVSKVEEQGHDKESAIAICHTSIMDGKSIAEATKELILSSLSVEDIAVKIGARHSSGDQKALQDIHDAAIKLGAMCPQPMEVETLDILGADKSVIAYGTEVKALGDGKLGGYLVRFGDDKSPDLTGEYFTKDTDFGDYTQAVIYYQHGGDTKIGKRKLSKGELKPDDVGVWIETQLALRDEYEKAIYALAEKGKLGWSSGTAAHLVVKERVGQATLIKSWPLGLDASLTPTPAEPRNSVITLKSYLSDLQPSIETVEAEGEQETPQVAEEKDNLITIKFI